LGSYSHLSYEIIDDGNYEIIEDELFKIRGFFKEIIGLRGLFERRKFRFLLWVVGIERKK
jgi:hypothetical protein